MAVPERHGGTGAGLIELCLLLERVGRTVAPVPAWPTLVCGALPVAAWGDEALCSRLLPGVVRGETLLSAALEEEGAGPRRPATRARRDGAGFRLEGRKIAVPIAAQAEVVLVPAALEAEPGVAVFALDPRAPGVRLTFQECTDWQARYAMELDGAAAAEGDALGGLARGAEVLDWIVERAIAGLCAIASGVAGRALEITAGYAAERKQFGKPIASFQAVSQRLADAYIDHQAISLTMWQAATRLAEGHAAPAEVATAKFWASEAGSRIGHTALHVHGGISIDVDYPIQRYFLWAAQIAASLGAATPQLLDLGRHIAAGA